MSLNHRIYRKLQARKASSAEKKNKQTEEANGKLINGLRVKWTRRRGLKHAIDLQ